MELRCETRKFGEVAEGAKGELRIFCSSKFCKKFGNETVEHVFLLEEIHEDKDGKKTIRPKRTNRYKRPEVKGIHQ